MKSKRPKLRITISRWVDMTTESTRALVAQMRESLSGAVEWLESEGLDLGSVGEGFNRAIAAADQWLAAPTAAGSREEADA